MASTTDNETDASEVYVFCKTCKQNIGIVIDKEQLDSSSSNITSVVSMHGEPPHAIMVYLDKKMKVRGIEYPYAIVTEPEMAEASDSDIEKIRESTDIDLLSVIDAFGMGKKKGIKILGNLVMQVLLSNPVYLIHEDASITSVLVESFDNLFTSQKISLKGIKHAEIAEIKDRQPFILDLQERKYVYEGIKVDTHFFENLVKESMDDDEGSFKLKNELSKIFYAYEKMKEIIRTSSAKLQETKLAKDIGIELTLMPHLLKMAASEEIDVKNRVESDGFARALRSI